MGWGDVCWSRYAWRDHAGAANHSGLPGLEPPPLVGSGPHTGATFAVRGTSAAALAAEANSCDNLKRSSMEPDGCHPPDSNHSKLAEMAAVRTDVAFMEAALMQSFDAREAERSKIAKTSKL